VLADLLAPSLLDPRRPVDRLVLNAHDAARDERLREVARRSGTPMIVDPLTMLLQSQTDPRDPWVEHVPFARAEAVAPERLRDRYFLEELAAAAVEFQVEMGATAVVAPYFYATRPDTPEFEASLAALGATARRMRLDGVSLPLVVILCAQHNGFAHRAGWQAAIDRFAAAAVDVGPHSIGLCLSPVGGGHESYAKLLELLLAARRLRGWGTRVIGWRQGVYGPALVAAGLDGYECGTIFAEQSDIAAFVGARRPRERKSGAFAAHGVYVGALGRCVSPKLARLLFAERRLAGRLTCDSPQCCPGGAASMARSRGRPHAVRERARRLAELDAIPNEAWRLNHLAKQAAGSAVLAKKANEVLAAARVSERIPEGALSALAQVAELLRTEEDPRPGPSTLRGSA
jgi:sugar phosphate isomerase/epimerase